MKDCYWLTMTGPSSRTVVFNGYCVIIDYFNLRDRRKGVSQSILPSYIISSFTLNSRTAIIDKCLIICEVFWSDNISKGLDSEPQCPTKIYNYIVNEIIFDIVLHVSSLRTYNMHMKAQTRSEGGAAEYTKNTKLNEN